MPKYWHDWLILFCLIQLPVVALWALARLLGRLFDRRPRESTRCIGCWYDLRGLTADVCPECGADLRLGVYPPGHPKRHNLVNLWAFWTALSTSMAVPVCLWFYSHCNQHRQEWHVSLGAPHSGLFERVHVASSGTCLQWPGQAHPTAHASELVLGLHTSDRHLALWIDPVTLVPTRTMPASLHLPAGPVSADMLREGWRHAAGLPAHAAEMQMPELDEIVLVLEFLRQHRELRLERPSTLTRNWRDEVHPRLSALRERETPRPVESWEKRPAPLWTALVPAAPLALIWLLGLWLIVRSWRRRNRAPWQPVPAAEALAPQ